MSEKLCIFCNNWIFDGGSPGYSEYTPGSDAHMSCGKSHWRITTKKTQQVQLIHLYGPEAFRKLIQTAETCQDYEQVKV